MFYELQPLRIQAGWEVVFNDFTEYDILLHGENDISELHEDLLQLYNSRFNLTIDLGWYREINRSYCLMIVKDYNWEKPLKEVWTKSKQEVINCIEKWVCYDFFQKYI